MSDWIVWLAAGLVLLLLEMLAPGVFMMWLGLAALGTGLVTLAAGVGFELQVVTLWRPGGDFPELSACVCGVIRRA